MKLLLSFIFVIHLVFCQDVEVIDLLSLNLPKNTSEVVNPGIWVDRPIYRPEAELLMTAPDVDPDCNLGQTAYVVPADSGVYQPRIDYSPPINTYQPPIYVPSTKSVVQKPPIEEVHQLCPTGSIQVGGKCISEVTATCPNNYIMQNGRCVFSTKMCPLNFEFDGSTCVQRHICPPNHVWKNNHCIQPDPECPTGWFWNAATSSCKVSVIQCQPGSILRGSECVMESITCPAGSKLINDQCVKDQPFCPPGFELQSNGFCTQITLHCPPGSVLIDGKCTTTELSCPPGTYQAGATCYENPTIPIPPVVRLPSPSPPPLAPFPLKRSTCPDGFTLFQNQCYRCPVGYRLCKGHCYRERRSEIQAMPLPCQNTVESKCNLPNINIDISKGFSDCNRAIPAPSQGYNIVNNIAPINNTVVNYNNISHPVTLNNVNENNIHIYTEKQCADGSLRTTIVKNNETVDGCVGIVAEPKAIDEPKKCCEIVTPRQCKQNNENQWKCAHRRYKYCGNFCVADQLYLRPPATTYNNNVLTMMPSQGYNEQCNGPRCQTSDCSGCTDGSFNCSPQCHSYPCQNSGCTYMEQQSFCDQVGGRVCDQ